MPYLVSAMSNWARAERLGYMTLDKSGKVSKAAENNDAIQCCARMSFSLSLFLLQAGNNERAFLGDDQIIECNIGRDVLASSAA